MNWYEDDGGNFWNLERIALVRPPKLTNDARLPALGPVRIEFDNDRVRAELPASEWPRLKVQLLNSQGPADRRPDSVPSGRTEPASSTESANQKKEK